MVPHATMGAVKLPGIILIILSAALMSSCARLHHFITTKVQRIPDQEPVAAQVPESEEEAALPDEAAPADTAATAEAVAPTPSESIQPTEAQQAAAAKLLEEVRAAQQPYAAPTYAEAPVSAPPGLQQGSLRGIRGISLPEAADAPTYPIQDAAQQHGLRSPSLPKLLPMDISGKVHSPGS